MKIISALRAYFIRPQPLFFISTGFLIWLFLFRGFFTHQFGFTSDALSYYDHIQFYVRNLARGELAFWDPYWSGGVPNDFFLRRLGPFNPLYLLIVLLYKCGLPYLLSYQIYLAGYVFLAAWGMFVLTRHLTADPLAGFLASILLLFSTLSTRIFDSYMLFITVPLIWFFYFLTAFAAQPAKGNFLGLIFCLGLLLTTYIPFYALIVIAVFGLTAGIVYFDKFFPFCQRMGRFAMQYPKMVLGTSLVLIAMTMPGYLFFQQAGKGAVEVSGRHYNTIEQHALAVQNQADDSWSIPEEFYFASYFSDLNRIIMAIVYVPGFAFVILLLGTGLPYSRLMVLLAVWGGFVLLMSAPFGSPVYSFLRDHIFIFKYFRNLHFFLWFALIPMFAVFVAVQFHLFRQAVEKRSRRDMLLWVILAHGAAGSLLYLQKDVLAVSWLTLFLSLTFFSAYLFLPRLRQSAWTWCALLFLVQFQPAEVYRHLIHNMDPVNALSTYEAMAPDRSYQTQLSWEYKSDLPPDRLLNWQSSLSGTLSSLYYSTPHYAALRAAVDAREIARFERYWFHLYDQVRRTEGPWDYPAIENALRTDQNILFVNNAAVSGPLFTGQIPAHPRSIAGPAADFTMVSRSMNRLVLRLNREHPGFFVWTNAYAADWQATVNGHRVKVYMVNGAYMGVPVAAGTSQIVFEYVRPWRYLFEASLLLVNLIIFSGTIFFTLVKYRRRS